MIHSKKGLYLVQIGGRICAQQSIFSMKSFIACTISETPHYLEVRKYKMWEQTVCNMASIQDKVQESLWWLLKFQSY